MQLSLPGRTYTLRQMENRESMHSNHRSLNNSHPFFFAVLKKEGDGADGGARSDLFACSLIDCEDKLSDHPGTLGAYSFC